MFYNVKRNIHELRGL